MPGQGGWSGGGAWSFPLTRDLRPLRARSEAATGRGQTAAEIDVQARHERDAHGESVRGCHLHANDVNTLTLGNSKRFFEMDRLLHLIERVRALHITPPPHALHPRDTPFGNANAPSADGNARRGRTERVIRVVTGRGRGFDRGCEEPYTPSS
ncbi:hypothetical protein FHS42_005120 [Streptomyces zagrosensis]|uniref:Uncharacterized protein n=1 Tax=Streptomyces zagrosensis TaxID=1042984 RepID=A0A7W9QD17_9ACTN|nr:hypothetical protein [Streptomyces zagrosensis]